MWLYTETMSTPKRNLIVDALGLAVFVLLAVTGLILRWSLPPGSGRLSAPHGPVRVLWGLDRHQWGEIHFWISVAFLAVLALHLALHWKWIVCTLKRQPTQASGKRWLLGVVGLFGLLSLAPLLAKVETVGSQAQTGQSLYELNCLSCHGAGARGILPLPADEPSALRKLKDARPAQAHAMIGRLSPEELGKLLEYLRKI